MTLVFSAHVTCFECHFDITNKLYYGFSLWFFIKNICINNIRQQIIPSRKHPCQYVMQFPEGSSHHIWAHLCPRTKYQLTLFIDAVYLSRQLLGQTVWPRNWLIEQTLTIPCANDKWSTNELKKNKTNKTQTTQMISVSDRRQKMIICSVCYRWRCFHLNWECLEENKCKLTLDMWGSTARVQSNITGSTTSCDCVECKMGFTYSRNSVMYFRLHLDHIQGLV